jgi:hypothetical protein
MEDGFMRSNREIELNYYKNFKPIRNKFRKYDSQDLILRILDYANRGEDSFENCRHKPWALLLLVKWILIDDQFFYNTGVKASDRVLLEIMQAVCDLESKNRMPDEFDTYLHFFRKYAHQQFIYQQSLSLQEFSRQFILFGDIEPNHKLRKLFLEKNNIDINDFLKISLATISKFINSKDLNIDLGWYASLSKEKKEQLKPFFEAVSTTLPNLRKILLTSEKKNRESAEYYEQTPFISNPFLLINESYWIPHRHILFRSIENFIYRSLSSDSLEDFNSLFTKKFEQHTENIIKSLNLPFINEKSINKAKIKGKISDFIVIDNISKTNILIEAKCVSATNNLMINDNRVQLLQATKANILKAIEQCCDMGSWLNTPEGKKEPIIDSIENFALIITYGELHILSGKMFSTLSGEKITNQIVENYAPTIPLENIFFISIGEFEHLVKAHIDGKSRIGDTLTRIRDSEKVAPPGGKRMAFGQYLSDFDFSIGNHQIIIERFEKEIEDFRANILV